MDSLSCSNFLRLDKDLASGSEVDRVLHGNVSLSSISQGNLVRGWCLEIVGLAIEVIVTADRCFCFEV